MDKTSLIVYNKKYEIQKTNERLQVKISNQEDEIDANWRFELRIRGKDRPKKTLSSLVIEDTEEFRNKLVTLKDDLIRFVHISDDLSLENKKKSEKTASFWLETTKRILDKNKMLIIDRGENLEDLEIFKKMKENGIFEEEEEVKPLFIE